MTGQKNPISERFWWDIPFGFSTVHACLLVDAEAPGCCCGPTLYPTHRAALHALAGGSVRCCPAMLYAKLLAACTHPLQRAAWKHCPFLLVCLLRCCRRRAFMAHVVTIHASSTALHTKAPQAATHGRQNKPTMGPHAAQCTIAATLDKHLLAASSGRSSHKNGITTCCTWKPRNTCVHKHGGRLGKGCLACQLQHAVAGTRAVELSLWVLVCSAVVTGYVCQRRYGFLPRGTSNTVNE